MPVIFTIGLGSFVIGILILLFGESPVQFVQTLWWGNFGDLESLGYTLFYAAHFALTGLAVSIPYSVGLLNIGGEGQIVVGAAALWTAHILFPNASFAVLMLASFMGGALAGGFVGWLKAKRGIHEVIVSILLNFVWLSLVSFLTLSFWKDPESQRIETVLLPLESRMPSLGLGDSPASLLIFFVVIVAMFWHWFFYHSNGGFRMRVVGENFSAAPFFGINPVRWQLLAFVVGGGLAGLSAANEVLSFSHRWIDGSCAGYGFTGIAVAFLGRHRPIGVLLSAFFFAFLFKGSQELDIQTQNLTRDFCFLIQGILVLLLALKPISWPKKVSL